MVAKRKKTTLGVIHVTATSPKSNLTQAALKKMHLARFSDIGYNEWISRDGKLNPGRDGGIDVIGAHVAGFNSISYGIALEGGVNANGKGDISTITDAQWKTLERRVKEVSKIYPGIKWCGHRDLSPDKNGNGVIEPHEYLKECPCFDVIPWVERLGLKGADIKGTWKTIKEPETGLVVFDGPDTRIKYLQRLLSKAGFHTPDDGIEGSKTKEAITQFQKAFMIKQTGTFDADTVKALREAVEYKSGPAEGPKAAEVITVPVEIQQDVPTNIGKVKVESPKEEKGISKTGVASIGAIVVAMLTALTQCNSD